MQLAAVSSVMARAFLVGTGILGFLAVALGAFGAHGLGPVFAAAGDGARRAELFDTAVRYHLSHACALGLVSVVSHLAPGRATRVAGVSFVAGVIVFSGTLYAMALGAPRWLGAITPVGGSLLLVGWLALAWSGARGAFAER